MLKTLMWLLSLGMLLNFTSCGGESSKEARELLQKILQFVGIPHSIVVNICQDENRDGVCGTTELFTKLTIKKGDSIDDIWQKVSLTPDGRYFLKNVDPDLPILVELQDEARVNQNSGKFTLEFDAFENREQNETKEISILEAMIDADALTKTEADKFRNLNNTQAQDKYYAKLLYDLESNINTLRANGLDNQKAVIASIKEMGDETRANIVQANKINSCGNDQACVDREIEKISDELIITEDEVLEIKNKQNKNDDNPPANNSDSNQNKIDMAKHYAPSSSMSKNYITYTKIDGQDEQVSNYSEKFTINSDVISQETPGGTQTITVKEDNVVIVQPNNKTVTYARYSKVGDTLYTIPLDNTVSDQNGGKSVTTGDMVCTLEDKMNEFSNRGYSYVGDILKVNCVANTTTQTTTNTNSDFVSTVTTKLDFIFYTQENIAMIASITDSCSEGNFLSKICTHGESYYLK